MANYLPVLLVSVTTNSVPDDSSVSTLPRAQVDYLSHDWQEEDVWKSWRNMTKQKNEIANGIRLENASWRTWWKQRNKLKTVTPETLNWLKDSDVTWLYGPLHTAVDWTPPPRPHPSSANADSDSHPKPNSPQPSSLDLDTTTSNPKHKPILKHRSISELLTSDLLATPFSPAESEDDESGQSQPSFQDPIANNDDTDEGSPQLNNATLSRPRLMHTKSDTHVTRWGPSRVFRKESPPRFVPSGLNVGDAADSEVTSMPPHPAAGPSGSGSTAEGSIAPLGHLAYATGSNSHLISLDASPQTRLDEPHGPVSVSSANAYQSARKKHISFNTFVEQCIAIDKPKSESPRPLERPGSLDGIGHGSWEYDEGYDEDDEDGYAGTCAIESESDSDYDSNERQHPYDVNESAVDDDDDDGILHMRTPSSPRYNASRSNSKPATRSTSVDTSTSTSTSVSNSTASTSSSSSSSSTSRRIQRRNSAPTRRRASFGLPGGPHPHTAIPMFRGTSDSSTTSGPSEKALGKEREQLVHVTIAPIAPTFLKTSGMGEDEDGEEDYPWNSGLGFDQQFGYGHDPFGWGSMHGGRVAGAGGQVHELGYISAGAWHGRGGKKDKKRRTKQDGEPSAVRAETPVELVYVPRVGSGFNPRYEGPDVPREDTALDSGPSPRRRAQFSVGVPDDPGEPEDQHPTDQIGRVTVTPASPMHSPSPSVSLSAHQRNLNGNGVVTTPPAIQVGVEGANDDPYDYFGGPDLGEDFSSTTSGRRWIRKPPPPKVSPPEEEERGRGRERSRSRSRSNSRSQSVSLSVSRSRSRSRTPSPSFISGNSTSPSSTSPEQALHPGQANSPLPSPGVSPVSLPKRANSFEAGRQTSPPSTMLSPPIRGRSIGIVGSNGGESRGRSVTRTSSSSFSDRDRSSCHSSPMGSLSPDGSAIGLAGAGVYGVYANGRVERERERDGRGRTGGVEVQRGWPRVGRSLNSSTSASPVDYDSRDATSSSLVEAALAAVASTTPSASNSTSPDCGDKQSTGVESSWRSTPSASSSSSSSTISEASSDATITSSTAKEPSSVPMNLPPKNMATTSGASHGQLLPSARGDSGPAMATGEERSFSEHEDGTTLGRAAGMLSSYLGLWPTTNTS